MVSIPAVRVVNLPRPRNRGLRVLQINVDSSFTIPGGFGIAQLFWWESNNAAITGGFVMGTTDGGVDVMAAFPVAALSNGLVSSSLILKTIFDIVPPLTGTPLFIHAVTSWTTAQLNLHFNLTKLDP
jgi:hypothetical protein